jgi:DNA-binding XRE family transcriptional regulator
MDTDEKLQEKVHHGRNVKCLREMLGMKQEVLADAVGRSQQTVSRWEDREKLNDELLEKIARVMDVPVGAIKNFTIEKFKNWIFNECREPVTMDETTPPPCSFNPMGKIVEVCGQNAKLYAELLEERGKRIVLLEEMQEWKR